MRIAVIGTVSSSMVSFRGPLLKALVDAGHEVFAFAMNYDEAAMDAVRLLGAVPEVYGMVTGLPAGCGQVEARSRVSCSFFCAAVSCAGENVAGLRYGY